MITLAAMLPTDWNVRLVNRNTEDLTAADLDWADMVMTGGMLPQQDDALALIDLAHASGKTGGGRRARCDVEPGRSIAAPIFWCSARPKG